MERRSRVNKYKDLRNSLNEELNKMVEPEPAEEAKPAVDETKSAEQTDLADLDELIRQNEELLGQSLKEADSTTEEPKKTDEPEQETVEKSVTDTPAKPQEDKNESNQDAGVFDFFLDDDAQDASDQYAEQDFDIDSLDADDNLSVGDIPDDFLGQTINEAKQYSMDKGERSALDTTSAIIDELTRDPQVPAAGTKETENEPPVPEIADLMKPEGDNSDAEERIEVNSDIEKLLNEPDEKFHNDTAVNEKSLPEEKPEKEETEEQPAKEEQPEEPVEPAAAPAEQNEPSAAADEENQRDNDLGGNYFDDEEEEHTPNLDKISQILSGADPGVDPVIEIKQQPEPEVDTKNDLKAINDLTAKLDKEQIMRTDLEEQTKQMQLDLDQLGDDVTTVNDKVNKTNKVLNSILVILIVALVLILGVVAYWALSERGVLPTGVIQEVTNPLLNAETFAAYLLTL